MDALPIISLFLVDLVQRLVLTIDHGLVMRVFVRRDVLGARVTEGEVRSLRVSNFLFQILVTLAHAQLVGVGDGVRREVLVLVIAKVEVVLPRILDRLLPALDLAALLSRVERAVPGSVLNELLAVRCRRHFYVKYGDKNEGKKR